ncbi:LacI family DNA-binding transcriptional regulator [Paractinoplanes lichenicola]|uniref:LacI family DNA-binding transcriptional regulator n=1 Tax=Paractinoplanes lichenicola TaxID=2802976 RepID=A0ABS1VTM4_9ACTN|nr:LacI family DNA-binding transcriptional regulator [Actinoplanes lichenicola]MBL7257811.1 LacI family DNA-binding transcriptional regulator [Actinoplanes lichenicola]
MAHRRPTMHDVARAAGVSPATVSRVVNNERYIRKETRAAVEQAIAELGFERNAAARSLRPGQTTNTVALVIEDAVNPFWSAVTDGAEEVARRHQHMLVVASTRQSYDRERDLLRDLVLRRRVDGVLVVPTAHPQRDLHAELNRWAPMVFLDRTPAGVPADAVVLDNQGGARRAVESLLAQGHRRVAYVGGDPSVGTGKSRLAGYKQALKRAGLPYDPALVRLNAHTVDDARAAATGLLGDADAFFADNNRMCVGVLHAVRGVRVGVAAFDDIEFADLLPHPITLVTYDAGAFGAHAAELLFARMTGADTPPKRSVYHTTLVTRGG